MPRDSDCVFCKIVSGDIPTSTVHETDSIIAFLDIGPVADGHLLIIPRDHYNRIVDLPASLAGALGAAIPKLGQALLDVTLAEGFNVLINQGGAAGQVVPHAHIHLIPRHTGDELGYRWKAGKYAPGKDAELVAAFKVALQR